jgi:hypothetical protein
MIKNFSLNWNNGQEENSISFEFSYDYETHLLKAIITLNGNSQVTYYSDYQHQNDEWLADKDSAHHTLMSMVVDNLMTMDSLPVVDEVDPRIISVTNALYKVITSVENGHIYWPGEKEMYRELDEACPFLDEMA